MSIHSRGIGTCGQATTFVFDPTASESEHVGNSGHTHPSNQVLDMTIVEQKELF